MPPSPEFKQKLAQPAVDAGRHAARACEFVHEGLDYTVRRLQKQPASGPPQNRHISGQQLCEGLRELALARWGRMARTVLRRWNITSTLDFGLIVFDMIEMKELQKLDEDSLDDFRNVYEFESAFETDYRIPDPQ